jgi:hypothetical protein
MVLCLSFHLLDSEDSFSLGSNSLKLDRQLFRFFFDNLLVGRLVNLFDSQQPELLSQISASSGDGFITIKGEELNFTSQEYFCVIDH